MLTSLSLETIDGGCVFCRQQGPLPAGFAGYPMPVTVLAPNLFQQVCHPPSFATHLSGPHAKLDELDHPKDLRKYDDEQNAS